MLQANCCQLVWLIKYDDLVDEFFFGKNMMLIASGDLHLFARFLCPWECSRLYLCSGCAKTAHRRKISCLLPLPSGGGMEKETYFLENKIILQKVLFLRRCIINTLMVPAENAMAAEKADSEYFRFGLRSRTAPLQISHLIPLLLTQTQIRYYWRSSVDRGS
jgi:hypothetical protein